MSEFWVFLMMLLSNIFTVLNILYFVFCMFVLIRPIFVSIVCEVLSTLRAGDMQGTRVVMIYTTCVYYSTVFITVIYCTLLYCTVQYSIQYCTVQYCTVYSTVLYSTVYTVQYCTLLY